MGGRNSLRNPRRSLLTMMAIVLAVDRLVFMLARQMGTDNAMSENAVTIRTGNIQVQATGYHKDQTMWQVVEHPDQVSK
ncbi:hypothetical protein [Oceanidesulfovibrio marinus]|uniref:Uncharacterized protein n=1 Tax=Oceanidesulfovibrio marinus TaxID=370038 RepID=A0A6P1Z8P9_9BACT|nr:hypothetical protein [Oceanidesulfovibrio marinus]TVM23808.1 hypothetical protein DQK91_23495 [Oceanidesulfovibrio marinus]